MCLYALPALSVPSSSPSQHSQYSQYLLRGSKKLQGAEQQEGEHGESTDGSDGAGRPGKEDGATGDGEKRHERDGTKRDVSGTRMDGDGTGPARRSDRETTDERINSAAGSSSAQAAGLVRLSLWRGCP